MNYKVQGSNDVVATTAHGRTSSVVAVVVVVAGAGVVVVVVVVVSNMLYTSHVCVTLTSRIYFLLTLAQGKKTAPGERVTSCD